MPVCGGWACSCSSVNSPNKRPAPCRLITSFQANLASLPPFLALPFPQQKPASKDHLVIQSSRLHHWLTLPQVPISMGQSSLPLLGTGFVRECNNAGIRKSIRLPGGICFTHIAKPGAAPAYRDAWIMPPAIRPERADKPPARRRAELLVVHKAQKPYARRCKMCGPCNQYSTPRCLSSP
jgi:hypothetical protein